MWEAVLGHNQIFSSILGLYSLDASDTLVVTTKKCPKTLPDVPWEKGQIIPA